MVEKCIDSETINSNCIDTLLLLRVRHCFCQNTSFFHAVITSKGGRVIAAISKTR